MYFFVIAVNPNVIKTLLGNGLRTFPIKSNLFFINGLKSLLGNSPACCILCNCVFENFRKLAAELFLRTLQSFETYVLIKIAGNYFYQ